MKFTKNPGTEVGLSSLKVGDLFTIDGGDTLKLLRESPNLGFTNEVYIHYIDPANLNAGIQRRYIQDVSDTTFVFQGR